jgi:hypothetical protein
MTSLVTGQIIVLECHPTRLYAEVIQILAARSKAWLRPLALVYDDILYPLACLDPVEQITTPPALTMPDVLWPLTHIKPALDTEVIPLLGSLSNGSPSVKMGSEPAPALDQSQMRQVLQDFVQQLWAQDQVIPGAS